MTREEAISLLRQVKEAILNSNSWDETTNEPITDSFDMAIKALEDSRWIPVTERLPEEETDVLVCNKDGKIELTCGSRSTEVDGFIWYTSGWKFGDVVAWMPITKPYEMSDLKITVNGKPIDEAMDERIEKKFTDEVLTQYKYNVFETITESREDFILERIVESNFGSAYKEEQKLSKERLRRALWLLAEDEEGRLVYTGYPHEDAIEVLTKSGWLRDHDREIYEQGRREAYKNRKTNHKHYTDEELKEHRRAANRKYYLEVTRVKRLAKRLKKKAGD